MDKFQRAYLCWRYFFKLLFEFFKYLQTLNLLLKLRNFFVDIGITLKGNSMVKYKFTNVDRSTISENIRIGFTTTYSQGFLIGFFSKISNEYLTISLTNGGEFLNYSILFFRFILSIKTYINRSSACHLWFRFWTTRIHLCGKEFCAWTISRFAFNQKKFWIFDFATSKNVSSKSVGVSLQFNLDVLICSCLSRLMIENLRNIIFILEILRMFSSIKFSTYI